MQRKQQTHGVQPKVAEPKRIESITKLRANASGIIFEVRMKFLRSLPWTRRKKRISPSRWRSLLRGMLCSSKMYLILEDYRPREAEVV